jgi:hypothetical protein
MMWPLPACSSIFSPSRSDLMDDRDRYDQGMIVRRAVLGDAHVDRSLTRRTPFTEVNLL